MSEFAKKLSFSDIFPWGLTILFSFHKMLSHFWTNCADLDKKIQVQDSCKISCDLQEFLAQAKFLQEAYHSITIYV